MRRLSSNHSIACLYSERTYQILGRASDEAALAVDRDAQVAMDRINALEHAYRDESKGRSNFTRDSKA
jgi:hypothetical protein